MSKEHVLPFPSPGKVSSTILGTASGVKAICYRASVPSLASIREIIATHPAVALYFTSPNCAVCHALKPKLLDAITSTFDERVGTQVPHAAPKSGWVGGRDV